MYSILFSLIGAGIGCFVGFIGREFWACLTCSSSGDVGNGMIIFCGIVGLIIGLISGAGMDQERNRANREAKRDAINDLDNEIFNVLRKIESNFGANVVYNKLYAKVFDAIEYANNSNRFSNKHKELINVNYTTRISQHKTFLENKVVGCLSSVITVEDARLAVEALNYLKALQKDDKKYDIAINKLNTIRRNGSFDTICAKENKYGEWTVNMGESPTYFDNKRVDEFENEIRIIYNNITKNNTGYFEGINNLTFDITEKTSKLMWYYAMAKPFDVKAFNRVVDLYNKFTITYFSERNGIYQYPKLEVLLARIYAVNQMGGENAVSQEMDEVRAWINKSIQIGYEKSCGVLASALSWMELYRYEKEVLAEMVKCKSQLNPEMQERYSFLMEDLESVNAKLYEVEKTEDFLYDLSATEWSMKDFDVFFRKLAIKKSKLNYSLAIDKWKKTLPLLSGQKISKEQIHNEFINLTYDYDGEIRCKTVNARAVNLMNIEDEGAELFEFVGKRNKCVSVLFTYEKYGRNLNLTILTLFTPSEELNNEELKNYALSIKENMYIDSFIESIRQVVDDVIKEKKEIYEDKKIIHEDDVYADEKKISFFE